MRDMPPQDINLYYKATIITNRVHWHQNSKIDQWKIIKVLWRYLMYLWKGNGWLSEYFKSVLKGRGNRHHRSTALHLLGLTSHSSPALVHGSAQVFSCLLSAPYCNFVLSISCFLPWGFSGNLIIPCECTWLWSIPKGDESQWVNASLFQDWNEWFWGICCKAPPVFSMEYLVTWSCGILNNTWIDFQSMTVDTPSLAPAPSKRTLIK